MILESQLASGAAFVKTIQKCLVTLLIILYY